MKLVPACSLSSADPDRKWGGGVWGDRVLTWVGGTKVSCKVAFILIKLMLTNMFISSFNRISLFERNIPFFLFSCETAELQRSTSCPDWRLHHFLLPLSWFSQILFLLQILVLLLWLPVSCIIYTLSSWFYSIYLNVCSEEALCWFCPQSSLPGCNLKRLIGPACQRPIRGKTKRYFMSQNALCGGSLQSVSRQVTWLCSQQWLVLFIEVLVYFFWGGASII